ncbi:hypothetical protein [Agrobacterium tumefaciens]|uniref:hypothetical protein n=1 Tax=Agrobacterium tumefaciens TaxID=358 RepID=UPI000DCF8839|nr:hypothetical protein [Agrobacterium tumefaciens]MDP9790968.1 hypothetical protein [Agrobacterium tumefaciens]
MKEVNAVHSAQFKLQFCHDLQSGVIIRRLIRTNRHKIYPAKAGTPVEVTIQALDLTAPGAASRVCTHEAEIAGYTLRARRAEPDLSDAELFATRPDGSRPIGGVFSRCMTRGNKMLVTHFLFDVSGVTDKGELDVRASQAQDNYKSFIPASSSPMAIRPAIAMREIPVTIGTDKMTLSVPDVWQVPINDLRGPLPAKLHLLRKNNSGEDTGLLWLAVQERKEQPDLEKRGPTLIGDYFVQQSPDAERPVRRGRSGGPCRALLARWTSLCA